MSAQPQAMHCTCMSGLTEPQVQLLELAGALRAIEIQVVEAVGAFSGPPPIGDPTLRERLLKLQLLIVQAGEFCREHGWKRGGS